MTTRELTEEIETAVLEAAAQNRAITARDLVTLFDGRETQYNVIAALRAMRMAGALIEIKGRLFLQRGFGGD